MERYEGIVQNTTTENIVDTNGTQLNKIGRENVLVHVYYIPLDGGVHVPATLYAQDDPKPYPDPDWTPEVDADGEELPDQVHPKIRDANNSFVSNPLRTDANGVFGFYARDGRYNIYIDKDGASPEIWPDQQIVDGIGLITRVANGERSDSLLLDAVTNLENKLDNIDLDLSSVQLEGLEAQLKAFAVHLPELERLWEITGGADAVGKTIQDIQRARIEDNLITKGVARNIVEQDTTLKHQIMVIEQQASQLGEATARIDKTKLTLTTLQEAYAEQILVIAAQFEDTDAVITEMQQTRATDNEAWAKSTETINATIEDNTATILEQGEAIATESETRASLAQVVRTNSSSVSVLSTAIENETDTRASEIRVIESAANQLSGKVTNLAATEARNNGNVVNAIAGLETKIEENGNTIANSQLRLSTHSDKLGELENNDRNIRTAIANLETSIEENGKQIASSTLTLTSHAKDIGDHTKDIGDLDHDNKNIRASLASLQTKTTNNKDEVAKANLKLLSHTDELGELSARAELSVDVRGRVAGIKISGNSSVNVIDISADMVKFTDPITKTPKLYFNATSGNLTLLGDIYAEGGTFGGRLAAATGTFSGELKAASGTFTGEITSSSFETKGNTSYPKGVLKDGILMFGVSNGDDLDDHSVLTAHRLSVAHVICNDVKFDNSSEPSLRGRLRDIGYRISAVDRDVSAVNGRVSALNSRVTQIENDITDIKNRLTAGGL